MHFHLRVLLCVLALASTSSIASNASGTIGQLVVGRNGNEVYFELIGGSMNGFPCSGTHPNGFRYVFKTTNPGGKEMLATILTAKTTAARILIIGNATCTVESTVEDVAYLWML